MKCPLCDSSEFKRHGRTANGNATYYCDVCSNIFSDRTQKSFCETNINFLKFKNRSAFQSKLNAEIEDLQKIKSQKVESQKIELPKINIKRIKPFIISFFCIGMIANFIIVNVIPFYHRSDVQTFHAWADCLFNSGREIYLKCDYPPNYPSIGLFASAGMIYIIKAVTGFTDGEVINSIFRSYLFLFDLLNLWLFIIIAQMMQFHKPIIMGVILFLIPSNLMGGAVWGQIDNISLSFCLISSIATIKAWRELENIGSNFKAIAWLILAMTSLSIFILVKQLSIFSALYFLLLFVITVIKSSQKWKKKAKAYILIPLVWFVTIFYTLDHIFPVPQNFFGSSYYYVWTGGGSNHGDIISANGFNIWIFLGRDPSSSSHVPFSLLWEKDVIFNVQPHDLGIGLYCLWIIFLVATTSWLIKNILQRVDFNYYQIESKLIAILFLFHGLLYLGFNVFLTGTHERYLYNGYPFLLLSVAWFVSQKVVIGWRLAALCFVSAFVYGCFVFSIIGPLPGIFSAFSRHEFLASIHLLLLILLTDAWIIICYTELIIKPADYINAE